MFIQWVIVQCFMPLGRHTWHSGGSQSSWFRWNWIKIIKILWVSKVNWHYNLLTDGVLYYNRVKGWDRLLSEIVTEWTGDVKSQLPKILGGVGPMHYLMQFGNVSYLPVLIWACDMFTAQGVVDFVWLPVQQYQQDGRVVRGLQRGATSLAASTGMATVELTTRLVQTIEVCHYVAISYTLKT